MAKTQQEVDKLKMCASILFQKKVSIKLAESLGRPCNFCSDAFKIEHTPPPSLSSSHKLLKIRIKKRLDSAESSPSLFL